MFDEEDWKNKEERLTSGFKSWLWRSPIKEHVLFEQITDAKAQRGKPKESLKLECRVEPAVKP